MIYSIDYNFVFIHCPRTSGTAISRALSILVPDAVEDKIGRHSLLTQLPKPIQSLRSFTVSRPLEEVRRSYHRFIVKWYRMATNETVSTMWLMRHAERLSRMTVEEYLQSDEPPASVDQFSVGCGTVFQYHDAPYAQIAEFCGVNPEKFCALVNVFRDISS